MTVKEHQVAEGAGMQIGEAWNILHWGIIGKATGQDLAERAKLAIDYLDKGRALLVEMATSRPAESI